MNKFMSFLRDEDGQGMIEYALIIALIAVVVLVALSFLGPIIKNKFGNIGNTVEQSK